MNEEPMTRLREALLDGIRDEVREAVEIVRFRLRAAHKVRDAIPAEPLDGPIRHTPDATTWDVPWVVSDTGPDASQPRWLVHTPGATVIADVVSERHARWIVDRWNREYASLPDTILPGEPEGGHGTPPHRHAEHAGVEFCEDEPE